ncbi:MAG: flagellar protein FlgN [Candidatus Poribacteria bacterium]
MLREDIAKIHQIIQRQIGLHRQLLDAVRAEREALISADLKRIQDITTLKQSVLNKIQRVETERLQFLAELVVTFKKPLRELTLTNIIVIAQGEDIKAAEQLRSGYNALNVLIQRITEQNKDNKILVEKSLEHVFEMKKNVLGESVPKSELYTPRGQKIGGIGGARLISKEA